MAYGFNELLFSALQAARFSPAHALLKDNIGDHRRLAVGDDGNVRLAGARDAVALPVAKSFAKAETINSGARGMAWKLAPDTLLNAGVGAITASCTSCPWQFPGLQPGGPCGIVLRVNVALASVET